jgi:hypothetical protein
MRRRCAQFVLFGVWILALSAGWCWMTNFQFASETVSDESLAPKWPAGSKLGSVPNRPTLVLFLHPRCPCSRASLGELERLFASLQKERIALPDIAVVATVPEIHSSEWTETETMRRAAQLPDARVFIDSAGFEAKRFGAVTSGTIMFFDASGRRLYTGGVTVARGIEGQNAGLDAIESLVRGKTVAATNIPVFGCRLCLPPQNAPTSFNGVAAACDDVSLPRAAAVGQ